MRTLHVIRRADDRLAFEAAGQSGGEAAVLLIQDGVRAAAPAAITSVYVSADDVTARGVATNYQQVTAVAMSELIVTHERVLVW